MEELKRLHATHPSELAASAFVFGCEACSLFNASNVADSLAMMLACLCVLRDAFVHFWQVWLGNI